MTRKKSLLMLLMDHFYINIQHNEPIYHPWCLTNDEKPTVNDQLTQRNMTRIKYMLSSSSYCVHVLTKYYRNRKLYVPQYSCVCSFHPTQFLLLLNREQMSRLQSRCYTLMPLWFWFFFFISLLACLLLLLLPSFLPEFLHLHSYTQ